MNSANRKVSSILVGVSGEYFVAAELSRRGYIASITLRNTKGIDVIASNEDGDKTINIQVKTNMKKRKAWVLNKKAEDISKENIFYIFVNLLDEGSLPEFHVVPSKEVATQVRSSHQKWLKTPGKKGQKHYRYSNAQLS